MITIEITGMSYYMVYDYSRHATKFIAKIYETTVDEIFFGTGDLKLVHNGIDQTSWHALIKVIAPKRFSLLEKVAAKYILKSISDFVLNAHIVFEYFEEEHMYHQRNSEYPPFFEGENEEESDEDYDEEDEDKEINDDEIYHGNVFAGFENKINAKKHECCHDDGCHCEDNDEDCQCGDHESGEDIDDDDTELE